MLKRKYPPELKKKVLALGLRGKTYAEIQKQYPIPKATLSYWFRNTERKPDRSRQLAHLKRARVAAAKAKTEIRLRWTNDAIRRGTSLAGQINTQHIPTAKALLAMLYWAEGAKYEGVHGLIFVNTDPLLMRLYMQLLRTCYPVDEPRFRARLHLHYYHPHREALSYWSETLAIPRSQFGKIYVKKRSKRKKFRKNFKGICFVRYPDSAAREELLALGRTIAEGG